MANNSDLKSQTEFHDHVVLSEEEAPNLVGTAAEEIQKGYWKSPKFLGSCLAIILLANNLFWGYAVPVNVLNIINQDIGPSPNIYLVSLVNTLIKGVCLLLVGSVSDAVGRRYFMIGAQTFSVIGAVLSATSRNVNMLIGANVFIGMAGSGQVLYPLLSQEIVPNKYRGWSQGVITLLVLPSIGFGPIIGVSGHIETHVRCTVTIWVWCYWLHGIVSAVSLVLFILCYFPPGFHQLQSRKSRLDQLQSIDYFGFILYAGGLICLLLGLSWGGKQYPWGSARIIVLLVIGILGLITFVLYENFMKLAQPLLPMSLFRIRNFWIAVVVGSVGQMSFYAMNVLWPMQVTNLFTQDIKTIGWMTCTTGLALTIGEIITGPLFKRFGNVRWQMVIGCIGLTIFGGVMALGNEHRKAFAIAITICNGLFIGWVELVAIVVAGLVVPPERIGTAQSFFASTRAVSGTIASSIYLAIYNGELKTNMPQRVTSAVLKAGLPENSVAQLLSALSNGTSAALSKVPGINNNIITAARAGQKSAWSASFSTVYLSTIAFGATALIVAWFATDISEYMTTFVNKRVEQSKSRVETEKA
ncbi:uncharacterized protein PV09_04280 [Verruconis gallopava]|uniref:Major facilitator superfamily (MFS) profile domain-containing protein n=1 Tax=Verruconis gallopava TaxID=253628 RepID=A0A0D1XPR5_9PEZI|nr:uncharacterized protein PV09_04280 [Verruconis gallopava]KIW04526.1 hypothetical protein PV09_04280 [Verruconis gallopava]